MLKIDNLIDDAKCYQSVLQMRWPAGITCVRSGSAAVIKRGRDERQSERQRYRCKACQSDFDDLTDTIFAHHHQPLRKWVPCLYLMGLNLSNEQTAQELELHKDDVHQMAAQPRSGIVERKPDPALSGTVECDEVSIVAGHKGHPEAVRKKGDRDGGADRKANAGAARLRKRSLPCWG